MYRIAVLCLLLSPLSLAETEQSAATLQWGNGDSLNGELLSAEGSTVTWRSPLFADPLEVDISVLSAVRFPDIKDATPDQLKDDFQITLLDTNILFGSLIGVEDSKLLFQSQRHGRFSIHRDSIRRILRNHSSELAYLGPRGLREWEATSEVAGLKSWEELDDGSLTTARGDATLKKKISFPAQCEIEVELSSTTIPDFAFQIGGGFKSLLVSVETWGDTLVLVEGTDFVELQTLPEDCRNLHFHIYVFPAEGQIAVFTEQGRKMGELQIDRLEKVGFSDTIALKATDSSLTLKQLKIASWNGDFPEEITKNQSRVALAGGQVQHGTIVGYSPETETLQFADPQIATIPDPKNTPDNQESKPKEAPGTFDVPLAQISRLVLSTQALTPAVGQQTSVAWKNGGFVSGKLVRITNQEISLQTGYSDVPIESSLQGVRRIVLPNTNVPENAADILFFDGGSLHGKLSVEETDVPVRWTPVGGLNDSSLTSGGDARFQRGGEPDEIVIDTEQYPDVVYLKSGDVFPGRIGSCDKKQVMFSSPVCDVRQLDIAVVSALEFGSSARRRQSGFGDDDWKKLRGGTRIYNDRLSLKNNAGIGHPAILTGDTISMQLKWKPSTYGGITFFLFTDNLRSPESSTPITVNLASGAISVSDRPVTENRQGFGFNRGGNDDLITVKNCTANLEFAVKDALLHVAINGESAKQIPLKHTGSIARGLAIHSQLTVMNQRGGFQRATSNEDDQPEADNDKIKGMAEIRSFVVSNRAGASARQFVQEEARNRATTVPRFRRDDPSTHVLIAANGDLLRGRLIAVQEKEIVFESRLERFRFPRERISSIVCLVAKDGEAAPKSPERPLAAVQAQLDNGYTLTMVPKGMSDGNLIGTSPDLGACKIPAKAIRDLFLGHPEGHEQLLSYVQWISSDAIEPVWEKPTPGKSQAESEMVGQTVDDFELSTLDGGTFRLSDHAEKVVVLDFWASWCGPCVAALPKYVEATSGFDESEVVFVAVNLEESEDRINAFLQQHNLSPTVAMDRGSVIAKRFKVAGIPHSVVIGPGGVIRHVTVGLQPDIVDHTRKRIQTLLADTLN